MDRPRLGWLGSVHAPAEVWQDDRPPAASATARSFRGQPRRRLDWVVVGIFVASGAAGLIYQVVWSSQLTIVFGNTTEAIGTIITAFMAGLGLGGLAGAYIAPRMRRQLWLYGAVEVAVGALALLVPVGFRLVDAVYRSAYDTTSAGQLTLVRLLLTLAVVTPVTFLMGLTLPLLTRHMVTSMHNAGPRMGRLYSANTFGAVAGTLLSGLVLIELFGLSATTYVAVGLNLLAGCTALILAARQSAITDVPAPTEDREDRPLPSALAPRRALLYTATFVSGFVALSLEVLWIRMMAEGTGSQIYNFVTILAVYLLGVASGGAIYRILSQPGRDTPSALALAFLGVSLCTLLSVPAVTMVLPNVILLRALVLLPATVCMGYAFPLTARLLTRSPAHGSHSIGVLYAWNTLGAILGSLAAAFILAATLGTNASILVLGAAVAAMALALVLSGVRALRTLPSRVALAASALVITPVLLVATGSPLLLTTTVHHLAATGLPFVHTEDRVSTVDALGGPVSGRHLYSSGISMTAILVDTKMMAYIPKVLRPDAKDFLDICFGMGTTFRSSLILGMHTDAVDLSPSVPSMIPVFYSDAVKYLHSPLARIITADGRNYVRLTSRRYDIVSVDPPPPIQSAGASVLYSREFYLDASHALRPDGLMLQWLAFGVDLDQLREHMRTFRSVFPHVVILMSLRHGGIYMLGSKAPITWDSASVARFLDTPQATTDIGGAPDSRYLPKESWPELFDSMYWMKDGEIDSFVGDGPRITDNHPLTEYYVLHDLFRSGSHSNVTEAMLRRMWPGRLAPGSSVTA